MLVLLLVVAAAALLVHGMLADQPVEVVVALALSLVAILVVLGDRWWRSRAGGESDPGRVEELDAGPEPEPDPEAEPAAEPIAEDVVVFAPGRTTFHRAACSSVAGKPVSSATREQLEAGGMTACRRCL